MRQATHRPGFTIVELLVVITIIVVLLAMLTPALDKAIYQAELTVCAAQMKGLGSSITSYSMDHARKYPYRPRARGGTTSARSEELRVPPSNAKGEVDDRPLYEPYMPGLALLQDPMSQKVNLQTSEPLSNISGSYQIWAGWQWKFRGVLQKGLFAMGDRLTFDDPTTGKSQSFSVLAADLDHNGTQTSHPDHQGRLYRFFAQDELVASNFWTFSVWQAPANSTYETIDRNFVMADNSVQRYLKLRHADGGPLERVYARADCSSAHYTFIPRD